MSVDSIGMKNLRITIHSYWIIIDYTELLKIHFRLFCNFIDTDHTMTIQSIMIYGRWVRVIIVRANCQALTQVRCLNKIAG